MNTGVRSGVLLLVTFPPMCTTSMARTFENFNRSERVSHRRVGHNVSTLKYWSALIGSLLMIAGCSVRQAEESTQHPARWEADVRAYAAQDAISPPPPNAIVFTGSSSIAQWSTLKRDMAPLTVINRGFGGSTMADAIYWIDALVLKYRPRAIVLYQGDNDIGNHQVTPEELLDQFRTFVARVHAELPETRIYFLAIKPSILRKSAWPEMRRANDLIRGFCATHDELYFVDVASPMLDKQGEPSTDIFEADGLHMKAAGYGLWTLALKPILLECEVCLRTTTRQPYRGNQPGRTPPMQPVARPN
jgi:lysophospholipase L1-like esterase